MMSKKIHDSRPDPEIDPEIFDPEMFALATGGLMGDPTTSLCIAIRVALLQEEHSCHTSDPARAHSNLKG